MPVPENIIHPLKYTFGYATGFIFALGIMIYLYLLITDHLDGSEHSTEEKIWMYLFLVILIIGFLISYYSITCSIKCLSDKKKMVDNSIKLEPGTESQKSTFGFGGIRKNIPLRPSTGYNNIRFSKFTV